jgi:hypothetical protein
MEESTMSIRFLARGGTSAVVIAAALAFTPAYAADNPCKATTPSDSAQMPAQGSSTAAGDTKPVPDGFGRLVVPGYGTTKPGTPSELAAEKKKGDQTADANSAASDPTCK